MSLCLLEIIHHATDSERWYLMIQKDDIWYFFCFLEQFRSINKLLHHFIMIIYTLPSWDTNNWHLTQPPISSHPPCPRKMKILLYYVDGTKNFRDVTTGQWHHLGEDYGRLPWLPGQTSFTLLQWLSTRDGKRRGFTTIGELLKWVRVRFQIHGKFVHALQ